MATNASKIDTATNEARAASKPNDRAKSSDTVDIDAIADAVETDDQSSASVKTVTSKPTAKKVAAKKKPAKKIAKKSASSKAASTKTESSNKDKIMEKAQTKTTEYTARAKEGLADLQTRAKTVYGKGSEMAGEVGEFSKGNMEAMVQSGKILASGMQDIGKTYVADTKAAVETMTGDVKEVAAVRSPTELVQLQTKIASRNFDATVAAVSKNTEAWIKLTNEAFAPISGRMSVAMEKIRKAA